MAAAHSRLHAIVSGRVQGVGYRYFVQRRAAEDDLKGFVRNLAGGGVEVVAEGPRETLQRFLKALEQGPPAAWIENIQFSWEQPRREFTGFTVRATGY